MRPDHLRAHIPDHLRAHSRSCLRAHSPRHLVHGPDQFLFILLSMTTKQYEAPTADECEAILG